ncbi:MAG TPA: efflux transporter outer membrane subunit [Acidobacteriaceae bacterium]|nr:efflux transporter outer membrane subunit [Acidobacteriaceae bacterium]
MTRSFSKTSTAGTFLTMGLIFCVTGCMVGPNYRRPSAPTTPEFKSVAGWQPAQPADQQIRGHWWEVYADSELNSLEEKVSVSNQSLKVAETQYTQARAMVQYQRANYFPFLSAGVSASRLRNSENRANYFSGINNQYNDFSLPLNVSWEPDVWGRVRRTVRAARENAQASAADVVNVQLILQAELALDYFQMRGLDAQQSILDMTVTADEKALLLTNQLFHAGLDSQLDVQQAQTQLEITRAQDEDVAIARAQDEHAIAILIGEPPASLTIPARVVQYTPPRIPPGLPSQLLERRPDIAIAERQMAGANEQIGIARSAYYPNFSLTGLGGVESGHPGSWFTGPSTFWSVGLSAADTLVDWGQRHALNTIAQANYDGTVANYREAVLTAYQEVEDNLVALHILEGETQTQARAVASAQQQMDLAMKLFTRGLDPYLNVIQAQNVVLSSELTSANLVTRRMTASVLLVKALGGGWDRSQLPKE